MLQYFFRQRRHKLCAFQIVGILLLLLLVQRVMAQHDCATSFNHTFNPDHAQSHFDIMGWIHLGSCTQQRSSTDCYIRLVEMPSSLNSLNDVEHSGATTVLTLLPTIDALFGTPTSEIWTMFMIIPFGGWLTMLVSFGGTMMPIKVEDYERAIAKDTTIAIRNGDWNELTDDERLTRRQSVQKRIRDRLSRKYPQDVPKRLVALGLHATIILWCGAQVSMGIVEQGGVLQWWCSCNWYMHLWVGHYFSVSSDIS
jgi:hypothetical protein